MMMSKSNDVLSNRLYVLLSKMTDKTMEKYNLTSKDIENMKWRAIARIFHIEEYDFKKRKYLINILRIVRQDIYYLIEKYAIDDFLKGAKYDVNMKRVKLKLTRQDGVLSFVSNEDNQDKYVIEESIFVDSEKESINTLKDAIFIFDTIYKSKRLKFDKRLDEFFRDRYQQKSFAINLIKSEVEVNKKIFSLSDFIDIDRIESYESLVDDMPYLKEGSAPLKAKEVEVSREGVSEQVSLVREEKQNEKEKLRERLVGLKSKENNHIKEEEPNNIKNSISDKLNKISKKGEGND